MEEIWKPIQNYEGLYEVSNLGRIRTVSRTYKVYNYLIKQMNERVIDKRIINGTINKGYRRICLTKDKKEKNLFVHRLVAQAFIPNPENKPFVNHIDGNKQNDCVTNLEWCDYDENNKHAYKTGLRKGKDKIAVLQYDLNGNFIKEYESINQASKETKLDIRHISRNIKGMGKQIGGFKFKVK